MSLIYLFILTFVVILSLRIYVTLLINTIFFVFAQVVYLQAVCPSHQSLCPSCHQSLFPSTLQSFLPSFQQYMHFSFSLFVYPISSSSCTSVQHCPCSSFHLSFSPLIHKSFYPSFLQSVITFLSFPTTIINLLFCFPSCNAYYEMKKKKRKKGWELRNTIPKK